ncbi:ribosomal protein S5 domain 2-type protein [Apodospora peruviana]|uniref:Ribosomal protein S5 domain 2-type protein n=1 Tax=Apodospora peruviana TaxID=516989 RepID=A0AAE0IHJ7_9PEZI|nr:ribosomal protein S5 domain 2-type protein [Apodospora peruviana]
MSDELADEVEAINSIYGPNTLIPYTDQASNPQSPIYILTFPKPEEDAATSTPFTASLRLHFPPSYPSDPLTILGVHSSGSHSKPGAAVRDLNLFSAAVGDVYEPGQVCLFDAIEKVKELLLQDTTAAAADVEEEDTPDEVPSSPTTTEEKEPPWTLSSPVVELKSTFIARCASVSSPAQAASYLQHLLSNDKKVRAATHNITAWRIHGPNGTSFQDCDDDGETAAGGRLLHLMQLMDLWDTMVVVTRWYGGQKLGPRRFAVINAAARDAFVNAGLVPGVGNEAVSSKKKSHGHHGK